MVQPLWETVLQFLKTFKMLPSNITSGYVLKRNKSRISKRCFHMFIAAQNAEEPKDAAGNDWISKIYVWNSI